MWLAVHSVLVSSHKFCRKWTVVDLLEATPDDSTVAPLSVSALDSASPPALHVRQHLRAGFAVHPVVLWG